MDDFRTRLHSHKWTEEGVEGGRRGPDGTRGYAYTHIHARARVRHTNARPSTVRERRGHGLRITQAGALFTCYYYRVARKKTNTVLAGLLPPPQAQRRGAPRVCRMERPWKYVQLRFECVFPVELFVTFTRPVQLHPVVCTSTELVHYNRSSVQFFYTTL